MTKHGPSEEEQQAAARAFLRNLIQQKFAGEQKAAAKAMGLATSTLNEFVNKGRGGGKKFLARVSDYAGLPIDVIMGRSEMPGAPADSERYPAANSAKVFFLANAAAMGVRREDALEAVAASINAGWSGAERWTPEEWYDQFKAEARRAGFALKAPSQADAEERRASSSVSEVEEHLREEGRKAWEEGPARPTRGGPPEEPKGPAKKRSK